MRKSMTVTIICSLLLVGCAGKKAVEDQTSKDVTPAAEQQASVAPEKKASSEDIAPAEPQEPAVTQAAERIFFEFDSYLLTPESKKALDGNARWLQALPQIRINIEGHTDERGSDTYNLALGEKRALAAREYLVDLGVDPRRINIVSYGEEKATRGTTSESAWEKDRRAEFVVKN